MSRRSAERLTHAQGKRSSSILPPVRRDRARARTRLVLRAREPFPDLSCFSDRISPPEGLTFGFVERTLVSNVNSASGSKDRRLRGPRVVLAGLAVLLFAIIAYFSLQRAPAPVAPVELPKDVAAEFVSIVGNVKTRGVGGLDWKTAAMNAPLRKSDLVRTYPSSSAEIKFFDDTRVTVRSDSLITIEETSHDPGSAAGKVAWKVSSGEINYATSQRAVGLTEAVTPTFRLAIEGNSAGTMRVGESGQAAVAQLSGAANLRTKTGEDIRLSANEGVSVDASGKAGLKQVLPSIPVLNNPGGSPRWR